MIVILTWVYYSSQILLFGAEFTQVYTRSHGSRKQETEAKRTEKEKEEGATAPVAEPVIVYRTAGKGGGIVKMAAGGIAGLLLGGISAVVIAMKSVKKLFTS